MRARMHLTLTGPGGVAIAEREARNSVMRSGAELVGRLFVGGGTGITHMGVGTSDAPEDDAFTTTALANSDGAGGPGLGGPTEAAIAPAAFSTTIDETRRLVLVRVRATLPAPAAVGNVREAGLISHGDGEPILYNRVTFAPIGKGDDHELTMFWEVSFPYGDLQWLL